MTPATRWLEHAVDSLPGPLLFGLVAQIVLLVLCLLACGFVWFAMDTD